MANFCPNCGEDITEKVKFCPKCGADISSFFQKKSNNADTIDGKKLEIKPENKKIGEKKTGEMKTEENKKEPTRYRITHFLIIGITIIIVLFFLLQVFSAFFSGMAGNIHPAEPQNLTTTQIPSTSQQIIPTLIPVTTSSPADLYKSCIEKYAGGTIDSHVLCANIPVPTVQYVSPGPTIQYIQPAGTNFTQYDTRAASIVKAVDWKSSIVKNFANQQVQKSSSGEYNINQICDVWESINHQWTYISDPPTFNYFTAASDSIQNGLKGNCLDYAILNAAVIQSIGGSTRIITANDAQGNGHAYAEVYLTQNKADIQPLANTICIRYHCNSINYHEYKNSQGNTEYWLNLDWQSNYPGGPFFRDDGTTHIFYPNGAYFTSQS